VQAVPVYGTLPSPVQSDECLPVSGAEPKQEFVVRLLWFEAHPLYSIFQTGLSKFQNI
jgi:hypothetical protein